MGVHKEISAHSKKQNELVRTFARLEALREQYIEEAVTLCKQKKPFSVEKINSVTKEINDLAKNGIVPTRKFVTFDMVEEYVNRTDKS